MAAVETTPTTKTPKEALRDAKKAADALGRAEDRHVEAIRQASAAGASRQAIAEAVGLSKTRVQQIIHGTNR